MEHLAQDLTVALEESESCGSNTQKWGMRRRTRSTGNLHLCINKLGEHHSDASSSSNSEMKSEKHKNKLLSFHQSDSDEVSFGSKNFNQRTSFRMRHPIYGFFKGINHCLESDSVNENSPSRPNFRRKRKFKRMSIDESTPIPPCGKRKRSQNVTETGKGFKQNGERIRPLHQSLVEKIEKFYQNDNTSMETQNIDENCEVASESSISWSGGEGHEGDDELTDWAPSLDNSTNMDQQFSDSDPREIRAGCRRLREERASFSISTSANERVARFLQDSSKSELRLYGAEPEKLRQLATLYSLDLWFENPSLTLLKKTTRTPFMQPTQRHLSAFAAVHKRIRTQTHYKIS